MSATVLSRSRAPWLRLLAVLAACVMIVAACGDDDDGASGDGGGSDDGGLLSELREEGTVRIGIANEPPFGFPDDDGNATGASVDVARAVMAELGVPDDEATVVEFGQLIGGLQAGQFDLMAAGMYINPERGQQVLFSDPDYCIPESLAVLEGNPEGIENYQSFVENPDLTLAVTTGTVEVGYAEDAGIPDDQLNVQANLDSMYEALIAGEADAAAGTYASVLDQVAASDGIEDVGGFIPRTAEGEEVVPPCGGYAFRTENQEFRDAFNEVLRQFIEDGTVEEIYGEYDYPWDLEKAAALRAEDLTSAG